MEEAEKLIRLKAIIESMRPAVQSHQGDIEFIDYTNNIVRLKFHGACIGCPFSFYTLKMGIEQKIKEEIPDVVSVIAI